MSYKVKITKVRNVKSNSVREIQGMIQQLQRALEDIKREIQRLEDNKQDK